MRSATLVLGMVMACTSAAWATSSDVIRLDDAVSLTRLRAANPNHYARAQKLIAAANDLCRPGPQKLEFARSDAHDVSCARTLLKTSNPPKREISFRLDDTRYMALVTVTDDPAKLVAAADVR